MPQLSQKELVPKTNNVVKKKRKVLLHLPEGWLERETKRERERERERERNCQRVTGINSVAEREVLKHAVYVLQVKEKIA